MKELNEYVLSFLLVFYLTLLQHTFNFILIICKGMLHFLSEGPIGVDAMAAFIVELQQLLDCQKLLIYRQNNFGNQLIILSNFWIF